MSKINLHDNVDKTALDLIDTAMADRKKLVFERKDAEKTIKDENEKIRKGIMNIFKDLVCDKSKVDIMVDIFDSSTDVSIRGNGSSWIKTQHGFNVANCNHINLEKILNDVNSTIESMRKFTNNTQQSIITESSTKICQVNLKTRNAYFI